MTIVMRRKGEKWQDVQEVIFADEAQLQKLLYDSPELIPTKVEHSVAVFTREAGLPGSGFTDLIGVDAQGNVLIVETKLARNSEIRRKVIGQVLEYAAYLWGMSFESFDAYFSKAESKSVLDLLVEKDPTLDREQLRQNIADNLASGIFQLIIAVDAINPELEKIISYIARRGSGLQFEALELELYANGELEILVPKRYGELNQPKEPQPGKAALTFDEILQNCPNDHSRELLGLLGTLWEESGNLVKPGTVGASFQAPITDKSQPIFWAYPDSLQSAFGDILKRGAPPEAVTAYRQSVSKLQGFSREDVMNKAQPIAKFSKLTDSAVREFAAASQVLVGIWRKSSQS